MRHSPSSMPKSSQRSSGTSWRGASPASPVKSQSRFVSSPNSALPDEYAHSRGRRTLESLPVSIGHFDVDAEDRATLSQHLLLSELRKAAALADRIQLRRGDSEYETFSTREGNSGRDPSGILDNWIHAKLARTIREVKSILVAADRFDSNSDNFVRRQLLLRQ